MKVDSKCAVGMKFGRLIVLERLDATKGYRMYLVGCDCGIKTTVRGGSLTSGNTKSCGCIKAELAAKRLLPISSIKKCIACGEDKALSDFHIHKNMADGRINKCKKCAIEYALARNAAHPEAVKASHRRWAQTENGKAKIKELAEKFPERESARRAVKSAITKGYIVRQPCFICGKKSQAHHPDYSAPLDVTWLCSKHHSEVHVMHRNLVESFARPIMKGM